MTDTLIATLSDVSIAGESLALEAAAMQTVVEKRLTRRTARPINNVLVCAGCESLYSISTQISQEGIIDWVKDKLSVLGRKITVAVNKVYAFITRADQATKDLIDQASHDDTVELPISGKKAAAILAAGAAVVGGITYFTAKALKGGDDAKDGSIMATIKAKIAAVREGPKDNFGNSRADYKKELAERRAKLRQEQERLAAGRGKDSTMSRGAKNQHLINLKMARGTIKDRENKLNALEAKTFLGKIRGVFSNIGKALKNFANSFKSAESATESAAKKEENKKTVWGRIKSFGSSIAKIFSITWKYIASIPRRLKGPAKK